MKAELAAALDRRAAVADTLAGLASELTAATAAMAGRLAGGAVLHAVGRGVSAIDAAHVRVEFLHPVTVGRRAIPATVGPPLHGSDTAVVALRLDDDPEVVQPLRAASQAGALVVDVTAGAAHPGSWADHRIDLDVDDVLVGRELQVTTYHLLWELVHEHLEAGAAGDATAPLDRLYPMLDQNGRPAAEPESFEQAVVDKASIVARLRADVATASADTIASVADTVRRAAGAGQAIWCMGNGGSSTDAAAFALVLRDAGVRAESLADDSATLTALANDVGFDVAYARMLRALGRAGDVAVAFSTSGDSANVVGALEVARSVDMATVGFAGNDGGLMADLGLDHLFVVPSSSVHRIQEVQTTLAHLVVELLR